MYDLHGYMPHTEVVKRVDPKISHHMGIYFSFLFFLNLYEMMNVNLTNLINYNHFMIYVNQVTTLNLYGTVCQLYLNKTGKIIEKMTFLEYLS